MKTFAFEMCENAFVIFFLSIRLESIQFANGNLLPMSKNEFAEKNLSMEIEIEILDVHWQSYLICISAIGSKISIQV
jgi:hypothetical protein